MKRNKFKYDYSKIEYLPLGGRGIKHATEDERLLARKKANHEYYLRNREHRNKLRNLYRKIKKLEK